MDTDGYPDDNELDYITKYEGNYLKLMEYVKDRWLYAKDGYWTETDNLPDYFGYKGEDSKVYEISTGGWSGNESLIDALGKNTMFWAICWCQSQRGGHYLFKIPAFMIKENEENK